MSKATGICKYCGKEFNQPKWSDGRYSNKLYCSDECCNANYRKNISTNKHISKCKYCGKEFKQTLKENGKYTGYIYCSEECQKQNYIETHPTANSVLREKLLQGKIKPEPRTCSVCGEKFIPNISEKGWVSTSTICSLECERQKYINENPDSVAAKKRKSKCEVCGKIFDSPVTTDGIYYNVKYCSEECRKSVNKHVEKERVCKQCGKNYIQINEEGSREFCSEECKLQFRRDRQFGVCKQCGKTFEQTKKKDGSYSTREFCSNECVNASYNKIYTCPACGKKFKREKINKVCCSVECENSGWELKQDYRICTCETCGKDFKRYRSPKTGQFSGSKPKYCSHECQTLGRKKNVFERYGDDFYAKLFKLAQEATGNHESVTNTKFADLLDKHNIRYTREYTIENYIYDFKLLDYPIVIEINPTYTHTVMGSHYNKFEYEPKFIKYHLDKTNTANKHNIFCIHIWQWDDWLDVINLIIDNKIPIEDKIEIDVSKKIFNPSDYGYKLECKTEPRKIWSKSTSKDYSFNEIEGYLPIYDCGVETWIK